VFDRIKPNNGGIESGIEWVSLVQPLNWLGGRLQSADMHPAGTITIVTSLESGPDNVYLKEPEGPR